MSQLSQEPITGAVLDIVNKASQLGEDWGVGRPAKDPRDEIRPTIPARQIRTLWEVSDVYLEGRNRWIIFDIDGEHVTLMSSNIAQVAIVWNTTLIRLGSRSAS